ncbi:hypothetical protein P170DRAFT_254313 [Aspergillus steynii IBT 23096]|uniref:Putative zinc-finger domain-containing protein n=1 Tax=Aspergillus steynii IBT 23096 TaxID=1392250 RepID=A0A2I2FZ17_9EURO|nr:uncharacterized protein P170DRAFT_254313 [Aspergillus steynii IBT 23096]PLB45882.1 hypothetical protein P170DRAFT_254313 [Aspergillus steynii IBT 23096]
MSNYPLAPASGLPSNYPQWPSSNSQSSAIPPLVSPNPSFHQTSLPPHQQPQGSMGRSFDYNNELNFNANARLPGPGAAGPLPTPPFPFMGTFTPPQFPPGAFSPAQMPQMPPLGYPPMPLPTAFHAPPSRPSTGDFQTNHFHPQPTTTSNSLQDIDREEGELTDREGGLPAQQKPAFNSGPRAAPPASLGGQQRPSAHASKISAVDGAHDPAMAGLPALDSSKDSGSKMSYKPASRDSMDLEEGETSSSQSSSSSRDSGSPYNPPVSMNTEALDRMDVEPAVSPNLTTETFTEKQPAKSPAQLRIQAQGALLGLAPHNIRYNELVGEGINPNVLKQLYEEVGIKISTPQPDAAPTTGSNLLPDTQQRGGEAQMAETSKSQKTCVQVALPGENATSPVSTPAPPKDMAKPMERKEVIARMLAAKAAKTSGASESPQADELKESPTQESSSASRIDNTDPAPLGVPTKEKEVRAKEKNKAQTELARQRIEQLKKQGLMRNQQKSQPESKPLENGPSNGENQNSDTADEVAAIQHSLPERPPDPESDISARIPGLFMTESKEDQSQDAYVTPVQGLVIDSTPQPRANQRKRPRASDFDEPIYLAKNELNNGGHYTAPEPRLIIDISDDEFYDDNDDDDDDSMDIETSTGYMSRDNGSTAPETSLRALESLPSRPLSASQGFSTPQSNSRGGDQDHLRRKNLEIQAMHRRIAELEQRKKAKLTVSRTQSPRSVELPLPTPPEPSAAQDTESYSIDLAGPDEEFTCPATQNGHSPGQVSSSTMDIAYFEKMRSRILRKREIESGVPALDAEIHKSETRLADLKSEEGKVLLEISRGKEGRKQLQDELNNINMELNGLTLDEVDAALVRLKTNPPQDNTTLEVPSHEPATSNGNDPSGVGSTNVGDSSQGESVVDQLSGKSDQALSTVSASNEVPSMPMETQSRVDSSHESSAVSSSESEGSAMDESSDSDSEDSMSIDEDESEGPEPEPVSESIPPNAASEPQDSQEGADQPSAKSQHSPREVSPVVNTENRTSVASESGEEVEMSKDDDSSESSGSDGYEPPEPETTASPANSVYSPPFSPPPPGPIEPSEASMPTVDQSNQAGELLTTNDQEVDVEPPKEHVQVGLLDNTRGAEVPQRKFSPYDSPLKHFNAYRYHPNYSGDTTQGYRSLTYSHNIDPMKYLCPFEAAGGVCNDRSCEFQHFRDMTLSGASTT